MKILRTPDDRFERLADFPWQPNYIQVDDGDGGRLRIHYLDEGPKDGETVLCLHGQPSWCYLYRKMIPVLTGAGHRVIAPDLVGFGRSDKPAERSDYTYARHVHWMSGLVRGLDLTDVTLLGQDWGGLIGLRVLAGDVDRFARVVVANTGLPDADGIPAEMAPALRKLLAATPALPVEEMAAKLQESGGDRPPFMYWIKYCGEYEGFRPAEVLRLMLQNCSEEEFRAWDAPFPTEACLQGARQFPSLVPIMPDDPAIPDNRRAWAVLKTFGKPFLTAFSDSDPVTAGLHERFQAEVPGARGQKHVTIEGAGHFLQDDAGAALAEVINAFIEVNPL